jgi:hypothetical protein
MLGQGWRKTMKSKELLIACALIFVSLVPATAGGADLSAYGTPVDPTVPVVAPPVTWNEPTSKHWPAHVCAEIQRVEKVVISGPLRPSDRGMTRLGLLMLEGLHCGIDVRKKMAADQAALEDAQRKAERDYEESMAAAQSAAARSQEPIIVQVPQAAPAGPAPARPLNCFTNRLGGGMSTTTCR